MMSFLSKPNSGLPASVPASASASRSKRTLTTVTWSPRCWSKPTAERTRLLDPLHLLGRARRVGAGLAVFAGGGDAVDGDRHRQALDRAGLRAPRCGWSWRSRSWWSLRSCRWSSRRCRRRRRRRRRRGCSARRETPPSAPALFSLAFSSEVWVERTTWPSGSKFSSWSGDAGQVEVGGDLDPRLAGADDAFDQVLARSCGCAPRPGVALLLRPSGRPCRRRRRRPASCPCSSTTVTRSGFRSGTAPATRLRMAGPARRRVAAADADDDRGGGRARPPPRTAGAWAAPGGRGPTVTPSQRADGAGQFAFQGALAVQVLDEVGLAQRRGVVEDLVADRARGRQALARQHQAGGGHLVAVDHDGRAVALDLVLDAGLVERRR